MFTKSLLLTLLINKNKQQSHVSLTSAPHVQSDKPIYKCQNHPRHTMSMNTIMTHDRIHEKLGSDKECIGLCDWGTFKKVYMCFESVVILKWGDMMISVIHIV